MGLKRFKQQNYEKLKKEYEGLGAQFLDPLFPATNASIAYSMSLPAHIEWKRPSELCDSPRLFVDGAKPTDVAQGRLGNCWFVAACAALAGVKEVFHKVIPDYKLQDWNPKDQQKHVGIFHFRFWRTGEWVDVVVDDLLPTIDGQLLFVTSKNSNEFWCALLEKAYAKLNGSYEALQGGNLCDALVDFTGGISQVIRLTDDYTTDEKRKELFKRMSQEMDNNALMCCAINAEREQDVESRTESGLVKGHAYGITGVKKLNLAGTGFLSFFSGREKIYMIRLQNPWGESEWSGAYSDGKLLENWAYVFPTSQLSRVCSRSAEWARISKSDQQKMGLTFGNDGEFWMPFEEFVRNFSELSICHLINTSFFTFSKKWNEHIIKGAWRTGVRGSAADRSGGCPNYHDSYLRNPQYRFDISNDQEDVIIQLSQKDIRDQRHLGAENLIIGFRILKVEENRQYRIHSPQATAASTDYIKTRSIFFRDCFDLGRYVLIPSTFEPGQTGEFAIRMFSGSNLNVAELTDEGPKNSWCSCVSNPTCVTVIKVKEAADLEKQGSFGTADPYCYIKCEGKTVKGNVVKDTLNPTWNTSAIFYRKKVEKPITVQVWNKGLIKDTFMGQVLIPAIITNQRNVMTMELTGRGSKRLQSVPGRITFEIQTEEDLTSF